MPRRRAAALVASALLLLTACGAAATGTSTSVAPAPRPVAPAAAAIHGPRVVAVGDLACPPGGETTTSSCRQEATARLAGSRHPVAALLPGDLQYDSGAAHEWSSFGASWGKLSFALHPAPGNHEYQTPGAAAYYAYFGSRAGPRHRGWYAFDIGRWRLYALNSNCDDVGCGTASPQARWLRSDLAAHPRRCVLAFWHHPRFSSGLHGDAPSMSAIWATLQRARADLVLEGHDHDYERFDPRVAGGAVDARRGIASIVVGTGGKSTYPVLRREPGSRKVVVGRFGVLDLVLGEGAWRWSFRTVGGAVPDQGSAACH